jgi:TatD DNase family protein
MPSPVFYDTHAHLDFPEFQNDLPELLDRAKLAGVSRIITIGTDLESSRRSVAIADQYPEVFAAVGWHPNHASEAPDDIRDELTSLARHPKVVAIGETGIDRYRLPTPTPEQPADLHALLIAKQTRLFQQQLEVAAELGLNCIIHQRAALDDTLATLSPWLNRTKGVFHCFVDGAAAAQRVLSLGCLVSFTGILTFKNAAEVKASLQAAPLGKFMLETDCPFLAPNPVRGKRCEPAYVPHTAQVMANLVNLDLEALSHLTCQTAHTFFPRLA